MTNQRDPGDETPEPVVQRFRHKKRGTTYTLLGVGCVQGSLSDDDPAVIYRGENGCLWVRPVAEFFDGRFEEVAPPSGDEDVERVARAAFEAHHLAGPLGGEPIEWGRGGYKTEVAVWHAVARAALAAREADNARLREALNNTLDVVDELYRKYETELDDEDRAVVQRARGVSIDALNGGPDA